MSGSGDGAFLADAGAFDYEKHEHEAQPPGDRYDNIINSNINADTDANGSSSTSKTETETFQSTCWCVDTSKSGEHAEKPRTQLVRSPRIGGCIDVSTIGELYPWRNLYGLTPRGDQVRLGFIEQQV